MIFDTISNSELYLGVNDKLAAAFDFIKKAVKEDFSVGKYELMGSSLYAMVQEYDTKSEDGALYEAHRKYIDLQYIISGNEIIDVLGIQDTTLVTDYVEADDYALYSANRQGARLVMKEGDFAIFFPNDTHMPGLLLDKASPVKKIVVKIAV